MKKLLVVPLMALAALCGCMGEKGQVLQLRLQPGEVRVLDYTDTSILGEFHYRIRMTVDSVDPAGVGHVTGVFEAIDRKYSDRVIDRGYTVEKPGQPPKVVLPDCTVAYDKAFTFEFHPDGTVTNLQGMSDIVSAIVDTMKSATVDMRMTERTFLASGLGDAEAFSSLFAVYPAEPVEPGDSWTRSFPPTEPGEFAVATQYTLREMGPQRVVLVVQSTIDTGEQVARPSREGLALTLSGGGETGTVVLDPATGWIQEFERQVVLSAHLESPDGSRSGDLKGLSKGTITAE